ncbi:MAG: hypothetical protein ACE10G_02420 [Gemmatimonadales bacterium]
MNNLFEGGAMYWTNPDDLWNKALRWIFSGVFIILFAVGRWELGLVMMVIMTTLSVIYRSCLRIEQALAEQKSDLDVE